MMHGCVCCLGHVWGCCCVVNMLCCVLAQSTVDAQQVCLVSCTDYVGVLCCLSAWQGWLVSFGV
jgi:hypothetical protein